MTALTYAEQERRLYLLGDTLGASLAASAGDIEEFEDSHNTDAELLRTTAFEEGRLAGLKEGLGEAGAARLADAEEDAAKVRKAYADLYANFERVTKELGFWGQLKLSIAKNRFQYSDELNRYLRGRKHP